MLKITQEKIVNEMRSHSNYITSFARQSIAFGVLYGKNGKKYTFSGMMTLIEKDAIKRANKIIKWCEND